MKKPVKITIFIIIVVLIIIVSIFEMYAFIIGIGLLFSFFSTKK